MMKWGRRSPPRSVALCVLCGDDGNVPVPFSVPAPNVKPDTKFTKNAKRTKNGRGHEEEWSFFVFFLPFFVAFVPFVLIVRPPRGMPQSRRQEAT